MEVTVEEHLEEWRHAWNDFDYGPYGNKACNLCQRHLDCGKELLIFEDVNDCCGGFKFSLKIEEELKRRGFWETVLSNREKKAARVLLEEWMKSDPYLIDTDGYLEFLDRRMNAEELKRLIRLGHPNQHGEPYSRLDVMKMISERGLKILEDLGWPADMDSHYMPLCGYEVRTLKDCLFWFVDQPRIDGYNADEQVWLVLENWEPTDRTETVYPKLTDRDETYAIRRALGLVADDFIPKTAIRIFQEYGKKEAIKFLRSNLSNFGCGTPLKPWVGGTPKGIEVCYDRDTEFRRISFNRILNHILEELPNSQSIDREN